MNSPWKHNLLTIPGVGASLLPKLACPLCWPAYSGLLSSVGLGFLISSKYLLPITAAFLVLTVAVLAFQANSRHGYGPFWLGAVSADAVVIGKFAWLSNHIVYAAVGLLVIASVWNSWPRRRRVSPTCCTEQ